ncbi:nuclear inhibitor of protein phosphatase 1 isoform X1 [Athalia rosae]|uniref:nuclear inhibitor of protein phosphatase 1 isoform X1 n=2 Tax=Athalia rosae TaxID=37344 RepID=UPI0006267D19|nr:nuclear inhibitor of protein phosphatase 1 isoform X1 [Athalia rosae]
MANHYEVPSWAGKPPVGLHLDVLKGDKLIQKLMVDEKKCYLFGRNQQMNDFCIDHASCSRVHSALVYHKHLQRAFLVDLGSTHGTYIGNMRLDPNKPTQLPIDSTFHFGASTRYYIIRERPQSGARPIIEELEKSAEDNDAGGLLGLPETETELDNLTEFNTAHNRRISMLGITDDDVHKATRKRKKKGITFNDDEEVINPEDVDPSVGRFRNLVQTTVVPSKRMRMEGGLISLSEESHNMMKHLQPSSIIPQLYHDLPPEQFSNAHSSMASNPFNTALTSLTSRLGIALPNPAPEVEMAPHQMQAEVQHIPDISGSSEPHSLEPKKKKYAKEAWPGKKPLPTLLV